MKTGIELIAQERTEQIEKHGRTVERDIKENPSMELGYGAIALLLCDMEMFPAKWSNGICRKMMSKSYEERLVIAGALIAAEIDRLQASLSTEA